MASWETYLNEHKSQYLDELLGFLRIPSISSQPDHANDVQRAAEWVSNRLQQAGMEVVQVLPTGGHPVVYGEWLHADGKPTILIYGHFDVQPVDPVDLWSDPPFEPAVRDNRVYARGAADDKGNMLIPILAVEALLNTQGTLPVNVKFFFEGQEEIGSPQVSEFIPEQRDLLSCDLILSADGGQWEEDQPSLTLGLRGICAVQIDVQGAKSDVHSGTYGGTFMNPIHALVQIVDSMRGPDGKILVAGFYDDVRSLSETERSHFEAVPYEEDVYKKELGVNELFGEPGYSTYERAWARPTLELNGIWGGYQGEGIKTVIPSKAHAKISCRLVPDQDPEKIGRLLIAHIEKHAPKYVKVTAGVIPGLADPYLIPHDHPGNQAARAVHKELYGKEPYYTRMGGTIPVCGVLLKALDAYAVNFAFGLKDENVHAPNEFFRLDSFERGQKAYCMLLNRLADWRP
ncbi:MAG: dipeptidase [Desulfobacterales bacterium]|jgi:acetylornithine deacetylase/succinyl-diaminopimelate desuccinylase-like protein